MELREAIAARHTVREYSEVPVAVEMLDELLRQAAAAPSACNRRGWKCIYINRQTDFDWLYRNGGSTVLQQARQAVLVCYLQKTDNAAWQDHIQSAAAFIAYFQLLAHEQGIGSCWLCHLPPKKEVAAHFSIPDNYLPVAVVTFGYSIKTPAAASGSRTRETELLTVDSWDFAAVPEEDFSFAFEVRKLCRKIYYAIPFRALFRGWARRYEKKFDE
jgi:nitroreductase